MSVPSRATASARAFSPRESFRLRARLALGALATLLAINNALPYFGLRDDSCQAMFSSLHWEEGGNNHLFLPQRMLSDLWRGWRDVHAEIASARPLDAHEQDLLRWLNLDDRELNTEATRAVIAQLCDRGHRVRLRYRHPNEATPRSTDDACTIPELSEPHAWIPVRLYETDGPVVSAGSAADGPVVSAGSAADGPVVSTGSAADGPVVSAGSAADGPSP